MRRDNTHISNTDSPAWGTGLRSHSIPARSSPERTTRPETSRRPRRTFNVILTPDSYSPLASRERLVTSAYSGLRDDSAPIVSLSYDPDIVCLQDLGDDSVNSTSPNSSLTTRPDSTPSPTPQNPQSDVNCNISDEQYHLRRFQNVVAKRLIPVNISAQADSPGAPGDVIVSLSKTCQPVRITTPMLTERLLIGRYEVTPCSLCFEYIATRPRRSVRPLDKVFQALPYSNQRLHRQRQQSLRISASREPALFTLYTPFLRCILCYPELCTRETSLGNAS